jgi:hypothetical protein
VKPKLGLMRQLRDRRCNLDAAPMGERKGCPAAGTRPRLAIPRASLLRRQRCPARPRSASPRLPSGRQPTAHTPRALPACAGSSTSRSAPTSCIAWPRRRAGRQEDGGQGRHRLVPQDRSLTRTGAAHGTGASMPGSRRPTPSARSWSCWWRSRGFQGLTAVVRERRGARLALAARQGDFPMRPELPRLMAPPSLHGGGLRRGRNRPSQRVVHRGRPRGPEPSKGPWI